MTVLNAVLNTTSWTKGWEAFGSPPTAVAVLVLALVFDVCQGELPAALHPVVYIGNTIDWAHRQMPSAGKLRQITAGGLLALGLPATVYLASSWGLRALDPWPWFKHSLEVLLLTSSFAIRELWQAARRVRDALHTHNLPQARFDLRSLCSRDASTLTEAELATASVESLAENASDSITAPLLYFALFGVPGALLYRAVNTLDAMLGYRDHREYIGKCSARLDDLLNLIPARLTAALFVLAGGLLGHPVWRGLQTWYCDGHKTSSPNAGRPMAAMAGLLEVCLDKPEHYRLGNSKLIANPSTILRCWRIVRLATLLGSALLLAALWLE